MFFKFEMSSFGSSDVKNLNPTVVQRKFSSVFFFSTFGSLIFARVVLVRALNILR